MLSYSNQHFELDLNVHDAHEVEADALRIDFNLILTRYRYEKMRSKSGVNEKSLLKPS